MFFRKLKYCSNRNRDIYYRSRNIYRSVYKLRLKCVTVSEQPNVPFLRLLMTT